MTKKERSKMAKKIWANRNLKGRLRRICACGCSQKVPNSCRYSYVKGHAPQAIKVRRLWQNPTYRKIQLGARNSPKTIAKKRKAMLAAWKRPGYQERLSTAIGDGIKAFYKANPQVKFEISNRTIAQWQDKNFRAKQMATRSSTEFKKNCSQRAMVLWEDPDFRRRCFMKKHPNKPEKQLLELLKKNFPREFYLNKKTAVGGRTPDFIHAKGKKMLIEMFGLHWHGPLVKKRSRRQEQRQRVEYFSKFGFKTVIIWENELKNEGLVIDKIRDAMSAC